MTPRPQLSLCIPVSAGPEWIQEFSENVTQFFQKFPLLYEVRFAVPSGQDQSRSLLQYFAERNPHYHLLETPAGLDRAASFEKLFAEARGDILIATDLDLATPLSEIFKMLEIFYSHPEIEVVFGDRTRSKKKLEAHAAPPDQLELFFKGVLLEKTKWPFKDPFCPILGMRQAAFEKIRPTLHSRGWNWTQEVQRAVQIHRLVVEEMPLYVGSRRIHKPRRFQAFREAFHLLQFVLFRV